VKDAKNRNTFGDYFVAQVNVNGTSQCGVKNAVCSKKLLKLRWPSKRCGRDGDHYYMISKGLITYLRPIPSNHSAVRQCADRDLEVWMLDPCCPLWGLDELSRVCDVQQDILFGVNNDDLPLVWSVPLPLHLRMVRTLLAALISGSIACP